MDFDGIDIDSIECTDGYATLVDQSGTLSDRCRLRKDLIYTPVVDSSPYLLEKALLQSKITKRLAKNDFSENPSI